MSTLISFVIESCVCKEVVYDTFTMENERLNLLNDSYPEMDEDNSQVKELATSLFMYKIGKFQVFILKIIFKSFYFCLYKRESTKRPAVNFNQSLRNICISFTFRFFPSSVLFSCFYPYWNCRECPLFYGKIVMYSNLWYLHMGHSFVISCSLHLDGHLMDI